MSWPVVQWPSTLLQPGLLTFSVLCKRSLPALGCFLSYTWAAFQRGLSILRVSSQSPQKPVQQVLQNGLVSPIPEVRMSPEVESPYSIPSCFCSSQLTWGAFSRAIVSAHQQRNIALRTCHRHDHPFQDLFCH